LIKAERLREMREKLGLSQRDLSRACGFGDNMVFRYENGLSDPTSKPLIILAQKLGCSVDYLLGLIDTSELRPSGEGLTDAERDMLEMYRREGWLGVARLSVERLGK
jgi:transcriptional regulator with XRE-family HTH domain